MVKDYIRDRIAMFTILLIFYTALFLIGFLYNIKLEKVLYIAEFTAFGAALCLIFDLFRYAERWREIRQILRTSDSYANMFYTVPGAMDTLYRELISKMVKEKEIIEYENLNRYTEMIDYYGMWAHQIKTPIAAMRILIQSGKDYGAFQTDRKLFDALQMELFKTEQYVEMVLSYLKIGDISKDMVLDNCDLGLLIRQAVKKYAKLFILQKISLELGDIEEYILTDEKWLSFVIEQILSNALKYTPKGSVSIYMKRKGVLAIKDTGIGISAEDLPRVMEKGYTGYNGRKDKESTGIGLYLCKKVMDKLGHGIQIVSEPGNGTEVLLELNRTELKPE